MKDGDLLVCVLKGRWVDQRTGELCPVGPKRGDIVTFDGYKPGSDTHIHLLEYQQIDPIDNKRHAYNQNVFVKINGFEMASHSEIVKLNANEN